MLNKYLEYKGNIRVFVRSRPVLPIDYKAYEGTRDSFARIERATKINSDQQIELEMPAAEGGRPGGSEKQAPSHMFFFDNVFGSDKTQEDIYNEVQHLVQSFLDGHDVCIFSYGQTGSGKTYTMGTDSASLASEATQGIIPRALRQILKQVDTEQSHLKVSFQEIYMDSIRDLLDPSNKLTQNNQALKYEPTSVRIVDQD